jgi:hypothetical protein
MERWKAYMKSSEAEWRHVEAIPAHIEAIPAIEERLPAPGPWEPDDVGAPWFSDCEPLPRAT